MVAGYAHLMALPGPREVDVRQLDSFDGGSS